MTDRTAYDDAVAQLSWLEMQEDTAAGMSARLRALHRAAVLNGELQLAYDIARAVKSAEAVTVRANNAVTAYLATVEDLAAVLEAAYPE